PNAVRRPVVRLRSALISADVSLVGLWTIWANPLNATIPIWVLGPWCSMNAAAAFSAAMSRLGSMSSEHMLPDTSMTRTIVVWLDGTAAIATGRPTAKARAARAVANSTNGRWRRRRAGPGRAAWTSDRLEKGHTLVRARRGRP